MRYQKSKLLSVSNKVLKHLPITPDEIELLSTFEKHEEDTKSLSVLKRTAVPLSLLLGFLIAVEPELFDGFVAHLPSWTNLSPHMLSGLDYVWNILSEPVEKANIVYHIPNIVLYSFGIVGIKKLIDAIERKTWIDKVLSAQELLHLSMQQGVVPLVLKKGASLLFVGKGDFIGMQFALNHKPSETVTISEQKPSYTTIWNHYSIDTLYEDLKTVITRASGQAAGEYVFFPVKDDQIFLPGEKAYDLSPHKLDILCQNIRMLEKEEKWKAAKRIIIIGDKYHKSYVQSEDQKGVIKKSEDTISLTSIAQKYTNVTLLDPTDIVLKKILSIAHGRKIVFRATKEGISEYKLRFYNRLQELGYKETKTDTGILTIGYDLFEDQTEQQTLSRKIDDYYPVVLSKSVRDALIRNGYKKEEFLYVPDLVLATLAKTAAEQ